jgi:hypothetical protein
MEKYLAMSWCLKREIKIYPVPINNTTLKICVDIKGKKHMGNKIYQSKPRKKDEKWWEEIFLLYIYYYKKN